jgi:hypothetical protein
MSSSCCCVSIRENPWTMTTCIISKWKCFVVNLTNIDPSFPSIAETLKSIETPWIFAAACSSLKFYFRSHWISPVFVLHSSFLIVFVFFFSIVIESKSCSSSSSAFFTESSGLCSCFLCYNRFCFWMCSLFSFLQLNPFIFIFVFWSISRSRLCSVFVLGPVSLLLQFFLFVNSFFLSCVGWDWLT